MLNGLDLFSGIGGLALALDEWVRPLAYCENDRYAQAVLLSRMSKGELPVAPIWDDVRTLNGESIPDTIDLISGGFPCQDISVAGRGVGLEGKRSGLFFEIMRLSEEIKPTFIFLENVPAIRTRGLDRVIRELSDRGYDSRWCALSAQDVGANHKRNRWFLLGKRQQDVGNADWQRDESQHRSLEQESQTREPGASARFDNSGETLADATGERLGEARGFRCDEPEERASGRREALADTACELSHGRRARPEQTGRTEPTDASWWAIEPDVGRVVNGLSHRVDRIKCLGNAVVPAQAKQAFMQLMGMK